MEKLSKWLAPQLLIIFIVGLKFKILLGFFFIILHEICHYLVAVKVGARVENFKVHPLGASLEISDYDELNANEEMLICLAGPFFNIITCLIFYILYKEFNLEIFHNCFEVNLVLGTFNLIPAYPLDGVKILRAILSKYYLYKKAYNITIYISYVVGIFFVIIFFLMAFIHKINISILISAIFIGYITYKEKERVMYIIMLDIVKKKKRFVSKKYLDNKVVSIHYNQGLINVLGLVDKNKFNIFYVLDDELKLIFILREDELLEAVKSYGNISLEEYYKRVQPN